MENEKLETMMDNYRHSEIRRKKLDELLDNMESEGLPEKEYQSAAVGARKEIQTLKLEREQMIRYMAKESVYVDEAETRLKEIERFKRGRRLIPPAPTNGQIDAAERNMRHFAQGMSGYKLFWVFFIGCFLGVLIEQLWCIIRTGAFEPRVGLIYGPFNLVYGIGAAALTASLYPFRKRTKILSLIGGALIGSVVEYGCSLFQEMVFGSVSWNYSHMPYNLHGRICLQYSVYWGILGVLWIKDLYPRMAKWILNIPNRLGKGLTWALAVFMIFNTVMSGLSVLRWMERRMDKPAENAVESYFDRHYPDERMESIFTNLTFAEE